VKNSLNNLVKSCQATAVQCDKTILWFNEQENISDLTYEEFLVRLKDVQMAEDLIKQHVVNESSLKKWAAAAGIK